VALSTFVIKAKNGPHFKNPGFASAVYKINGVMWLDVVCHNLILKHMVTTTTHHTAPVFVVTYDMIFTVWFDGVNYCFKKRPTTTS